MCTICISKVFVWCVCVLPDEGSGYGQNGADEPSGMSDDQRLEVLPQPETT